MMKWIDFISLWYLLIRSAVREPRAAGKFGLTSIDCLDYRVAANSLETAGDYAVELSNSISELGRISTDLKTKFERSLNCLMPSRTAQRVVS